jgi:hypothetical protein
MFYKSKLTESEQANGGHHRVRAVETAY